MTINNNEELKKIIREKGLVFGKQERVVSPRGKNSAWLFDLRAVFLDPAGLDLAVNAFWRIFEKDYPFQVGGQELGAVPLIAAIVLHGQRIKKPVNGFVVRKSRKPVGLQKFIEGHINQEKIILVDDLINDGATVLKQISIIRNHSSQKISDFFTFVNFRGKINEQLLAQKDIRLTSLFGLEDFGLKMFENKDKEPLPPDQFKTLWRWQSPNPAFFLRVPKSAPCLDETRVYFGVDNGHLIALNQEDGTEAWRFKVGWPADGKSILSSPACHKDRLYFGSYDGNVYALDKNSGQLCWKNLDAEYIGSSPAIAPKLNTLFIGQEFGLFRRKGGLTALDLDNGQRRWSFETKNFIHCTPSYCPEKNLVAVGDNDGLVYLFNAKNGRLLWQFASGGPVKSSLSFDAKNKLLLFGSFDKNFYALDLETGEEKGRLETKEAIFSTPVVAGDNAYIASLDKNIYSLNLKTGQLNWRLATGGRLFASPLIVENKIYIGATDGKLYEIDVQTGQLTAFFQTVERITNKIAYNPQTKRFFLLTYANELYCLEKS